MPMSYWMRVDDRLLHGQVTVGWRQHLRYDTVWVVDDGVRSDPLLEEALRLAAPAGVSVRVYSVSEGIAALASAPELADGGSREQRCLLLVKSPQTALSLVEGGMPLEQVNVGNLAARPGAKRVFKSISLTREQARALDALSERGVRITFQLTPHDMRADWQIVRRRNPDL